MLYLINENYTPQKQGPASATRGRVNKRAPPVRFLESEGLDRGHNVIEITPYTDTFFASLLTRLEYDLGENRKAAFDALTHVGPVVKSIQGGDTKVIGSAHKALALLGYEHSAISSSQDVSTALVPVSDVAELVADEVGEPLRELIDEARYALAAAPVDFAKARKAAQAAEILRGLNVEVPASVSQMASMGMGVFRRRAKGALESNA